MATILDKLTELLDGLGIDTKVVSGIHTQIPSSLGHPITLKVDILTSRTEDNISQYTFTFDKELEYAD